MTAVSFWLLLACSGRPKIQITNFFCFFLVGSCRPKMKMAAVIFCLLLACSGKPKIQVTESVWAVSGWLL